MNHKKVSALSIAIFIFLLSSVSAQRPEPKKTIVKGDTLYTVLDPGAIPAIFEPEFLKAVDADSFYFKNEPVIVVAVDNEAKAYSTWHLDQHEVVNDYINGTAITVTW